MRCLTVDMADLEEYIECILCPAREAALSKQEMQSLRLKKLVLELGTGFHG